MTMNNNYNKNKIIAEFNRGVNVVLFNCELLWYLDDSHIPSIFEMIKSTITTYEKSVGVRLQFINIYNSAADGDVITITFSFNEQSKAYDKLKQTLESLRKQYKNMFYTKIASNVYGFEDGFYIMHVPISYEKIEPECFTPLVTNYNKISNKEELFTHLLNFNIKQSLNFYNNFILLLVENEILKDLVYYPNRRYNENLNLIFDCILNHKFNTDNQQIVYDDGIVIENVEGEYFYYASISELLFVFSHNVDENKEEEAIRSHFLDRAKKNFSFILNEDFKIHLIKGNKSIKNINCNLFKNFDGVIEFILNEITNMEGKTR